MTRRDHYICAALAGVVARTHYPKKDSQGRVKPEKAAVEEAIAYAMAAMQEADRAANGETDMHPPHTHS